MKRPEHEHFRPLWVGSIWWDFLTFKLYYNISYMLFWLREWDTKLFSRHFERKKNLKNHEFSSKIYFCRKKGWFGACPSLPKSRKCFQNKIQTFLQLFQKRFFAANHCKKNYSILKIFIFFEKIEKKFFFSIFPQN